MQRRGTLTAVVAAVALLCVAPSAAAARAASPEVTAAAAASAFVAASASPSSDAASSDSPSTEPTATDSSAGVRVVAGDDAALAERASAIVAAMSPRQKAGAVVMGHLPSTDPAARAQVHGADGRGRLHRDGRERVGFRVGAARARAVSLARSRTARTGGRRPRGRRCAPVEVGRLSVVADAEVRAARVDDRGFLGTRLSRRSAPVSTSTSGSSRTTPTIPALSSIAARWGRMPRPPPHVSLRRWRVRRPSSIRRSSTFRVTARPRATRTARFLPRTCRLTRGAPAKRCRSRRASTPGLSW